MGAQAATQAAVMRDIAIAAAIVLVLIVGLWWTRGAGPGADEIGSPGAEERVRIVSGESLQTPDDTMDSERRGYRGAIDVASMPPPRRRSR